MKLDLSDLDSEDPSQVFDLCVAHLKGKADAEVTDFVRVLVIALADIKQETVGSTEAWELVFGIANHLLSDSDKYNDN